MLRFKRTVSLLLTVFLVVTLSPTAFAADIDNTKAESATELEYNAAETVTRIDWIHELASRFCDDPEATRCAHITWGCLKKMTECT